MNQEFKLDVLRKTLYVKKPYEDFTHGITVAVDLWLQDESDEMLSRGFKDQIYDVYRYLPPDLQVSFVPSLQLRSA